MLNPKRKGCYSKYSSSEWILKIMDYHNFEYPPFCFFCSKKSKGEEGFYYDLTVDHIIDRSQGGSNKLPNFQILCCMCHKLKNEIKKINSNSICK